MSPKKEAWDAQSWDELKSLISLEDVTRLLWQRERQKRGDKRRNADRRAILQYVRGDDDLLKKALKGQR